MSNLKKLQCDNCGGLIDRATLICTCCGTQYERKTPEADTLKILHVGAKCDTLHSSIILEDEILRNCDTEDYIQFAIGELSRSIAKELTPYLAITRDSMPHTQQTLLTASVKVIRPNEQIKSFYEV